MATPDTNRFNNCLKPLLVCLVYIEWLYLYSNYINNCLKYCHLTYNIIINDKIDELFCQSKILNIHFGKLYYCFNLIPRLILSTYLLVLEILVDLPTLVFPRRLEKCAVCNSYVLDALCNERRQTLRVDHLKW